jgi:hypothetical protein
MLSVSALGGGECLASCSGFFTPTERAPYTHCIETEPRAGLDVVTKLFALSGPWLLYTQSLYWLSFLAYPSIVFIRNHITFSAIAIVAVVVL